MRILIVLMMLLSTTVWSAVNTDGLTEQQKAEIALQVAQKKAANKIIPSDITPKEVQEYAVLGESIAKALGSCAKEMGIAVNDFAESRVGMIATVLIIWKVAGKEVMKYVVGISLFAVGLCVWIYLFRKMCIIKCVTYHDNGKKNEVKNYTNIEVEGVRAWMMVIMFGLIITCCLIMFAG